MTHSSCPLCRRSSPADSAEYAPATKLCDQCRIMVEAAFRRSGSVVTALEPSGTQIPIEAPSVVYAQPGPITLFDDDPSSHESFAVTPESPRSAKYDEPAWDFDFDEDLDITPRTDIDLAHEVGEASPQDTDQLSAGGGQLIDSAQAESADNYTSPRASYPQGQAGTLGEPALDSATANARLIDVQEDAQPVSDKSISGPGENPLFAWDYSDNAWPVLVGPKKKGFSAKSNVRLLLLALVALVGALYFLVYQSVSQGQRTISPTSSPAQERVPAVIEPRASVASSTATDDSNQAELRSSDKTDESKAEQSTASDAKSSNGNEEAHGRFSLQAAAFPTQASADEFAAKLRHAGVGTYVVNADLARRGRWFRVRVGRFDTAEEAQRFAAEAQLRAKAAGLSLQLIVCQYEQP